MDKKLKPQLQNEQQIKNVLRQVPVSFTLKGGAKVETLLAYLPIKNGATDCSKFFEIIKDGILQNFVFSCSEIENKIGVKSSGEAKELFEKSVRKISEKTAQGELGELILFTLLDVYFQAPKILSKVSMKTSRRVPVFGADAVHGQFYGDNFKLFLGESKLHKKFSSGASKSITSIENIKEKYNEEFDLLESYMDFSNLNEELQSQILELLNPYSDIDLSNTISSPCFIGFTSTELILNADSEGEFIDSYKELARGYIGSFFNRLEHRNINMDNVSLLLLPFSCIDELVKEFVTYMGIEK